MGRKWDSGCYERTESKTCDECGGEIGDYTIHEEIVRCADCLEMYELNIWDDFFPDGIYAFPRSLKEPRVKVRALYDYCQSKGGISPKELSLEEMEMFLIRPKNK